MKKALYVFLVCLLMVVPLSGCQGSENNDVFETLSVTLDGEKTLNFDMNQEEVRTVMGEEPSETTEDDKKIYDNWESFSLYVDYLAESPHEITRLAVSLSSNTKFETSLGIAKGDSAASVKEKLGEICMTSENDSEVSYSYGLLYADGKYQIVDYNKPLNELVGDQEDAKVYLVNFSCVDDKVAAFYISDVLGGYQ